MVPAPILAAGSPACITALQERRDVSTMAEARAPHAGSSRNCLGDLCFSDFSSFSQGWLGLEGGEGALEQHGAAGTTKLAQG